MRRQGKELLGGVCAWSRLQGGGRQRECIALFHRVHVQSSQITDLAITFIILSSRRIGRTNSILLQNDVSSTTLNKTLTLGRQEQKLQSQTRT